MAPPQCISTAQLPLRRPRAAPHAAAPPRRPAGAARLLRLCVLLPQLSTAAVPGFPGGNGGRRAPGVPAGRPAVALQAPPPRRTHAAGAQAFKAPPFLRSGAARVQPREAPPAVARAQPFRALPFLQSGAARAPPREAPPAVARAQPFKAPPFLQSGPAVTRTTTTTTVAQPVFGPALGLFARPPMTAPARRAFDGDDANALRATVAALRLEMDALRAAQRDLRAANDRLRREMAAARHNATLLAEEVEKSDRLRRGAKAEVRQLRDLSTTPVAPTPPPAYAPAAPVYPPQQPYAAPPVPVPPAAPAPPPAYAAPRPYQAPPSTPPAVPVYPRQPPPVYQAPYQEAPAAPAPVYPPPPAAPAPYAAPPPSAPRSSVAGGFEARNCAAAELRRRTFAPKPRSNLQTGIRSGERRAPTTTLTPRTSTPKRLVPEYQPPPPKPRSLSRQQPVEPFRARVAKGSTLYQQLQLEQLRRLQGASKPVIPESAREGMVLPFESDVWGFAPVDPSATIAESSKSGRTSGSTILANMAGGSDVYRDARLAYVRSRHAPAMEDEEATVVEL